jgi:hypothetical protein
MNIEVTELNTDFLKQGTKVIVLNGGSASSWFHIKEKQEISNIIY